VQHALLAAETSLVIVDDPAFIGSPGAVPLLVVGPEARRVIADGDGSNGVAAEIERRLAKGAAKPLRIPRRTPVGR
jgi:hypothetical protein